MSFNYLGQIDQVSGDGRSLFQMRSGLGSAASSKGGRSHLIEVNSIVVGGCFQCTFGFSKNVYDQKTMEELAEGYRKCLLDLIEHVKEAGGEYTSSDAEEFSRWR